MPAEPTVCCVLLTRDRPEMAARAVASFRAQTYERKVLLAVHPVGGYTIHEAVCLGAPIGATIGELRNHAMRHQVAKEADIIAHWDDDDWSHPNRLAEQVALLQSRGAQAVGYSQALFWDTSDKGGLISEELDVHTGKISGSMYHARPANEAWIYTAPAPGPVNIVLGASLLYWRRTWQQKPFQPLNRGEDTAWISGLKVAGESGVYGYRDPGPIDAPRMICGVHDGNSSTRIDPRAPRVWIRAEQWDSYCRDKMRLEGVHA